MTEEQKLELGIEIVSAMKASAYDVDIEEGRAMALSDTEPHLIAGCDFHNESEETKEWAKKVF